MTEKPSSLAKQLTEQIRHMTVVMQPEGPEDWPDVELTMPQLRALIFLSQRPGRMSDIAAYLGASLSTTTSIVDRLVEKGLVTRLHDTHDRRVIICSLSDNGRQEIQNLWHVNRTRIEEIATYLTDEQLESVVTSLRWLAEAVEQHARDVRSQQTGTTSLEIPVSSETTVSI